MSALPRNPSDFGYAGLRMTADEFLALGHTPEHYELIDGVVTMTPSPRPVHGELIACVVQQAGSQLGQAARIFTEIDLRLTDAKVYRPDISIYKRDRLPPRVDALTLPPDLIVEVLSAGTMAFDLTTKRDDYETFCVNEYWAIDPNTARLRCWQRNRNQLLEVPVTGNRSPSSALPGLVLDLAPMRAIANPQ